MRAVLALALSFAMASATSLGQPAPAPQDPALATFFQALDEAKAGTRDRPVHILWLGDSHSAADHITGPLRARLQARFGEGGRGVLPPGIPYAGYNPRQVTVEVVPAWRQEASFLDARWSKTWKPGEPELRGGAFGLSGWRIAARTPHAAMTVKADPEARFDRAVVCARAGSDGAALTVAAGPERRPMDLTAGPACRTFEFALGQRLDLIAERGEATVLSVGLFRDKPGVVLSNLGVIGTRLADFAARDEATLNAELDAYRPDLIVLAWGTNDGFEKDIDGAAYATLLRQQLQRLKRLAPNAALLVVGAPDAQTIRPDIPMDGIANKGFSCAPLSASERADFAGLIARRDPALARWYAPPNLAVVRDAQRRAAAAEGASFWDWQARMGGDCSAHALSRLDPREVRGDHIHFTSAGGERIADLFFMDLMRAFEARKAGS